MAKKKNGRKKNLYKEDSFFFNMNKKEKKEIEKIRKLEPREVSKKEKEMVNRISNTFSVEKNKIVRGIELLTGLMDGEDPLTTYARLYKVSKKDADAYYNNLWRKGWFITLKKEMLTEEISHERDKAEIIAALRDTIRFGDGREKLAATKQLQDIIKEKENTKKEQEEKTNTEKVLELLSKGNWNKMIGEGGEIIDVKPI